MVIGNVVVEICFSGWTARFHMLKFGITVYLHKLKTILNANANSITNAILKTLEKLLLWCKANINDKTTC